MATSKNPAPKIVKPDFTRVFFVFSSAFADTTFNRYSPQPPVEKPEDTSARKILQTIVIPGGAGLMLPRAQMVSHGRRSQPLSEEDIEWLRAQPLFKAREEQGFYRVERQAKLPHEYSLANNMPIAKSPTMRKKGETFNGGEFGTLTTSTAYKHLGMLAAESGLPLDMISVETGEGVDRVY